MSDDINKDSVQLIEVTCIGNQTVGNEEVSDGDKIKVTKNQKKLMVKRGLVKP